MKKFLFLIAWCEGSESNTDGATGINQQEDLLTEYKKGNSNILSLNIIAPNEKIAAAFGYEKAFYQNFTAHDTVSDMLIVDGIHVPNDPGTPTIIVDLEENQEE